jgi:hypothetical protein
MQNAQSFNLSRVVKLRLDYLENFTGIRKPNATEIIIPAVFQNMFTLFTGPEIIILLKLSYNADYHDHYDYYDSVALTG